MKKSIWLLAFAITFSTQLNAQNRGITPPDLEGDPGDPEKAHIEFDEILYWEGVLYPETVMEQILIFENVFEPALSVIRNVDISGLSREDALSTYYGYIGADESRSYKFMMGISGIGVPYLNRCIDDYVADKYGVSPNSFLPASWYVSGYTIK